MPQWREYLNVRVTQYLPSTVVSPVFSPVVAPLLQRNIFIIPQLCLFLPPLLLFQSSVFCGLYFHLSCYYNFIFFIIVVAVHHSVSLSHSLPRLELLLKSSTFPPSRLFDWPCHHGLYGYSLFSYPTSRTQSRPGRPRRLGVLQ